MSKVFAAADSEVFKYHCSGGCLELWYPLSKYLASWQGSSK